MNDWGRRWYLRVGVYLKALLEWTAAAIIIGGAVGAVGAAFHHCVDHATELRALHPWLLWCLPLAGLVIVGLYKAMGAEGLGTDDVIDAVQEDHRLKWLLAPSIFLGTVLTHLCGGSAGREGAALQIGGTIGQGMGRLLRMDEQDLRIATMAGMAACFSALFGTPLTAAIFAMVCASVGSFYHAALLPCLLSALTAWWVSLELAVEPTRFALSSVPALTPAAALRTVLLAVLCALISMLFCGVMHGGHHLLAKFFPNSWLRAAAGGCIIIALTYLSGSAGYNGAGMGIITAAVEEGTAHPAAFLWKLLFTAVTLGAGFKGGEVVPSFFVGATFGCIAAPLLGLPAGFGAALGLISVFCGVTNCPLASIVLSVELFGSEALLFFALSCAVSYVLSGYDGLYSRQTILYSKLKARYINVHTNDHHAEEELKDPRYS